MSEWEAQVKNLQNNLNEIKVEIKENREEIVELKQDLATGKGAIKTVLWLGGFVTLVWTTIKVITILK